MNKHTTNATSSDRYGRALSTLNPTPEPPRDAGSAGPLTAAEQDRADATFTRIIATDPTETPTGQAADTRNRQRPIERPVVRRRLVVAGLAAAAVAAVVIPAVTIGGGQAYASWTPTPVELTGTARQAATDACVSPRGGSSGPAMDGASAVIAERRGDWTYLLLRSADRREMTCVMPQTYIDDPTNDPGSVYGGGPSADNPQPGPLGTRQVDEYSYLLGRTDEGLFTLTEGAVGDDVAELVVTTPDGDDVTASVEDGRYAAWWPSEGVKPDDPEFTNPIRMKATLTDGTTIEVQAR